MQKMSNLSSSCNRFCRYCFTNKSVCDNHICETRARLLEESKNLIFPISDQLPISDQESASKKSGEQISVPFSHSSLKKVFFTLNFVIFMILDIKRKMGKQPLRGEIKCIELNDTQTAAQIKNSSLADTLPDLKITSRRLESLISDIRNYRGVVGLDISYAPNGTCITQFTISTTLIKWLC